jgi:tRNA threonylcarbamoyladenosine biosynthesis protein TsaB
VTRLIAFDTATDALSVALQLDDELRAHHEVAPRRHQQRIFTLLDDLADGVALSDLGLDAVIYGRGPGSFTGLRIAASAAQGLAFSLRLVTVGVSSLETQVHTLRRHETLPASCVVISTIDARIGELYCAFYRVDGDHVQELGSAVAVKPEHLCLPDAAAGLPLYGIGSGFALRESMPGPLRKLAGCWPQLVPEARDMLGPARRDLAAGRGAAARAVRPDYVQRASRWKTLAEQGRSS